MRLFCRKGIFHCYTCSTYQYFLCQSVSSPHYWSLVTILTRVVNFQTFDQFQFHQVYMKTHWNIVQTVSSTASVTEWKRFIYFNFNSKSSNLQLEFAILRLDVEVGGRNKCFLFAFWTNEVCLVVVKNNGFLTWLVLLLIRS